MSRSDPHDAVPTPSAVQSHSHAVLRWLVPLRFFAAGGQAAALLIAQYGMLVPLPYAPLWAVTGLLFLSNIALVASGVLERPDAGKWVVPTLVLDATLFTLTIHWSGGRDNPFSALYIIYIAFAAMTGSRKSTWFIAGLSAAFYALVFPWSEPRHFWHAPFSPGSSVGMHAFGMWLAVTIVGISITFFMTRIIETLRESEAEARRLSEVAARNARLASLTTLAAGAAHELGSPLGTIAVIARELERQSLSTEGSALREDAQLLRAEVGRCRSILDRMSARAVLETPEVERPLRAAEIEAVLRPIAQDSEWQRIDLELQLDSDAQLGLRFDFVEIVSPILRNALDASPRASRVGVEIASRDGDVRVTIRDAGSGMDEATLARASEPFFTTRSPGRGTGLGLFVVRLHLERLGGSLRFESQPGRGTTAVVEWPIENPSELAFGLRPPVSSDADGGKTFDAA